MAIDFRPGFPGQQTQRSSSIQDDYQKYTQLGLQMTQQQEANNLQNFESEVADLFRTGSMPDGKIQNMGSGYTWTGTKGLPDRKTAYANYKYIAKKYDIDLDYVTSAKFDEIYAGMMSNYGQQLGNQIANLSADGMVSDDDIREAAMNPTLSKILNTLAVDGGQPAFNQYLPKATTAEKLMKKASNLSLLGGAGALTAAGTASYLGANYGPAAKDYLFGKESLVLKPGQVLQAPQNINPIYQRQMPTPQGQLFPINRQEFQKIVTDQVKAQNPKFNWSVENAKLNKNGWRGWNSKEAYEAAKKVKNQIAPKKLIGVEKTGGGPSQQRINWEKKKTPGKLSKMGTMRGMAWLYPTLAEQAAEGVFGEDTMASGIARTVGGGFAMHSFATPALKTVSQASLKQAAKKGFGSYFLKKMGTALAGKAGPAAVLASLDGPVPVMDIIIAIAGLGYTGYEAMRIINEWKNVVNK